MDVSQLLREIDAEIKRLEVARAAITTIASGSDAPKRRGRPKKAEATPKPARKKRVLSPEARAKIAEAQKRRWAAAKKAAK